MKPVHSTNYFTHKWKTIKYFTLVVTCYIASNIAADVSLQAEDFVILSDSEHNRIDEESDKYGR